MTETVRPEAQDADRELGELIGSGRMAEVYSWGSDQVAKLCASGAPVEQVAREAHVAETLTRMGAPVPRFGGTVLVGDRSGILFERIHARSMIDALSGRPWRVLSLARQLADLHMTIHQRAVDASLPAQFDALRRAIAVAPDLPDASCEYALHLLDALPVGDRLCHGDFHPDNVLMAASGPIAIDWITAVRGCPAADVARTLMILRFGGLPPNASFATAILARVLRGVFAWGYWRRYRSQSGLRKADVAAWQFPVVAARLRENMPDGERKRLLSVLAKAMPYE